MNEYYLFLAMLIGALGGFGMGMIVIALMMRFREEGWWT